MSKEQTAKKERFLREVERQLLRKGLDSEMTEGGILNVKWHGQLLCDVDGDGVVCFPSKTVMGVDADASLQTVIQIASQVREYMPIFARAPALKAIGLEGSYKILADFGDAVLAGRLGKKGAATENPLEYGKAEVQILFEPLQAAISSMELPKNFENKKLPNTLRRLAFSPFHL